MIEEKMSISTDVIKVEISNEDLSTISPFPNLVTHVGKQRLERLKRESEAANAQEDVAPKKRRKVKRIEESGLSEEEARTPKRKRFYRNEVLNLLCEWNSCFLIYGRIEDFMRHVATHVKDAEVKINPTPLPNTFLCLWAMCGFECSNSDEMVRHIHFHTFHTKIKCHGENMLNSDSKIPRCKLDSSQRNKLPDLTNPFVCEWEGCQQSDVNWHMPQDFYWHVRDHPEELRGKELKCLWRGCSKQDSAVSKIKEHMKCHSQEKLVGCPNCGGMYANRVKFFDHCTRQHGKEHGVSLQCPKCAKTFAIERHLRDHMRAHINFYKCPYCDMTCPSPSTLATHIRYRHTDAKPYSCEFCSYKGKTPSDIKSHVRVHYHEVEIECQEDGCSFKCRSKLTMKHHESSIHNNLIPKYACHLCDTKVFKGTELSKHLVNEHKFSLPSGHSRFRYTKDDVTGLFHLQTVRFENVEVQQEIKRSNSPSVLDKFIPYDAEYNDTLVQEAKFVEAFPIDPTCISTYPEIPEVKIENIDCSDLNVVNVKNEVEEVKVST